MPGVVVDISEKAAGDPTATLEAEDLENWELQHGPLPHGGVVLLRTGWGKFYYTDYSKYLGTDTNQAEDMTAGQFGPKKGDIEWVHYNEYIEYHIGDIE